MRALHGQDGKGKEATDGITNLRARVEDSGSESHLLLLVERRQEVDRSREEGGCPGQLVIFDQGTSD